MDEIEEMEGYEDVITTVEEPEYITTVIENPTLKNVMYNFLSSNMNIPNDLTSILLAAAFLIISWKALQIIVKLLLAVLWPIIAFSSLFFLLPMLGQEQILSKIYIVYNYSRNMLINMLHTVQNLRK